MLILFIRKKKTIWNFKIIDLNFYIHIYLLFFFFVCCRFVVGFGPIFENKPIAVIKPRDADKNIIFGFAIIQMCRRYNHAGNYFAIYSRLLFTATALLHWKFPDTPLIEGETRGHRTVVAFSIRFFSWNGRAVHFFFFSAP